MSLTTLTSQTTLVHSSFFGQLLKQLSILSATVTKASSGTAFGTTPGMKPVYFSDCFLGYYSTAYSTAMYLDH